MAFAQKAGAKPPRVLGKSERGAGFWRRGKKLYPGLSFPGGVCYNRSDNLKNRKGVSSMSLAQILAIVIFVAMFVLIVLDKFERHHITLICGAATLLLVFGLAMRSVPAMWETLNLQSFFTVDFWYAAEESGSSAGINWSTILFILGMMIMVEGMAKAGFFRWLCLALAKLVHYKTVPLFLAFMLLSAVLAMFIDSITVILFLAAVTVELAKLLKFNPIPMIISEIFCANLGGSATMCGDPPNIIIGTALGYSFADFLVNTGLIAGVGLIAAVVFFYLAYRKELRAPAGGPVDPAEIPAPESAISSKADFAWSCVIFAAAVADMRPREAAGHKLKKGIADAELGTIDLVENPDILATLGERKEQQVVVGFAAETNDVVANAEKKLVSKHADLVVANEVGGGRAFGADDNVVWFVDDQDVEELPRMSKTRLADEILNKAMQFLA